MPRSIDISSYEKAALLEDALEDDSPRSSASCSDSEQLPATPTHTRTERWIASRAQLIRSPFMFLLDLFLLVLIVVLATRKESSAPIQLQGDMTGLVPPFKSEVTMFKAHPEFISNHTSMESLKEARQAWIDFLPRGQGYISISPADKQNFDLPPLVEYKGSQSLGTSWMHGLHCLYVMMSEYDMLAMGMREPGFDTWHMDHCIDYVRQLIICGGDMALAGGDLPGGSSFLDVPHVCKNYGQMYAFLEERRDNDAYQFGSHETHYVPP